MSARWNTGRRLRVFAAPLLLAGLLTGLGSTVASAQTCQAWTGEQPANPDDTGSGDSLSGVDMLSACNVWVAGARGDRQTLIEHWTGGSTWIVVPNPSPGAGFNSQLDPEAKSQPGTRGYRRADRRDRHVRR